jgi:predicted RNase H-like nuclease (RuvC/YqgF family)
MTQTPQPPPEDDNQEWTFNYFNYFTEIEEHFQRARGTGLFLLSPLDWALIETWKNSGIPLEAVLRGIDAAFESWRKRRVRSQMINSLAYCAQAVMREAEAMAGRATPRPARSSAPPFSTEELRAYLESNAAALRRHNDPVLEEIAQALDRLAADIEQYAADLEDLERRLTALEERMIAAVRARQSEEDLVAARRELDRQLRPYRAKMTAEQLAMLEKQFLERRLLESLGLPRLSLFYLA